MRLNFRFKYMLTALLLMVASVGFAWKTFGLRR